MSNKLSSDKQTRNEAVPFVASSFCYGTPMTTGEISEDADAITGSSTTIYIRCATPKYANLVEAYLTLIMAVGSALTVKVAIGYFDTDDITAITSYSQSYIDASHYRITGTTSAIASSGGILLLDGLNLLPELPKRNDSDFNENGFVLILQFSRARTGSDTVTLYEIDGSALLGLI